MTTIALVLLILVMLAACVAVITDRDMTDDPVSQPAPRPRR